MANKLKETYPGFYEFRCAGCGARHYLNTNPDVGGVWQFNGDLQKPTASPSLKVRYSTAGKEHVCHFFLKNGMQEFCSDCTHENAGKTLEIPYML